MALHRWKKFLDLSKLRVPKSRFYVLTLLSLPVLGLAASQFFPAAKQETSAIGGFPFKLGNSGAQEFMGALKQANLSVTKVCSQGQVVGLQASAGVAPAASEDAIAQALEKLKPDWKAQLAAAPFPQLHTRAKQAKTPVMMYHDILPEKQVFFDVTPEELEAHFQRIKEQGLTPIRLDQLVENLRSGVPLPPKPIVLTFDDGYEGHYTHVYPLMKKYGFPATFSIYPSKVDTKKGRSSLTWAQLKEMSADPLVTIASHSVSHPSDMRELTDAQLQTETVESKRILEEKLGIAIKHFVYPEGKNDERVQKAIQQAGYETGWTMSDERNLVAQESDNLLNIARIGQSQLELVMEQATGGSPLFFGQSGANVFSSPVELTKTTVNQVPLIMVVGGRPTTIHAKSRYQVAEIVANTNAVAAVDGTFFSLEFLDSNKMIGPILSSGQFTPGNASENKKLTNRPLVLISDRAIKFIPFSPDKHNTQAGLDQDLSGVKDAFVAGAWLVKEGQPQPTESFNGLYGFDAVRDRAFWGVDASGRPMVGVSGDMVDSVTLGQSLSQAGLRDVVMLDSGASASLVYRGESMMSYEPRPVPHVVALMPPDANAACDAIASK
jgi:poly-beta-1,6-N-acetyl-D-glucosamine N-deacetylase